MRWRYTSAMMMMECDSSSRHSLETKQWCGIYIYCLPLGHKGIIL